MGTIRIGISGWRYPEWRGVFYPEKLPQSRELEFASRAFATVEINGSFYGLQRPQTYTTWRETAPDGFIFGVKGHRLLTHVLRLRNVEQPLANLLSSGVLNLREKLGPFLWQLPPGLAYDASLLEDFLALLPHDTDAAAKLTAAHEPWVTAGSQPEFGPKRQLRHAIEVRHPSFANPSFIALLRKYGVALVVADTAGKWPYLEDVTADFMYLRLHGDTEIYASGYSDAALERWAARVHAWSLAGEPDDAVHASDIPLRNEASRDVYCYFDNSMRVMAPFDAQRLIAKLGLTEGLTPVSRQSGMPQEQQQLHLQQP